MVVTVAGSIARSPSGGTGGGDEVGGMLLLSQSVEGLVGVGGTGGDEVEGMLLNTGAG